ncbi:DUF87 domain-containing protein [Solirubrobacter ginsenosidimutans]|uniref:DUF87 domain-containing protein n=1 Tax=Solirubrobacter ginsenosidimutans TaxID=490573 RepID=A0A9X3N3D1_9ACTN|nr:DUF87 domain-containing protein [Solirubrobacter ginsenosidimutans]MDA0166012.1 DUF87 domain-containing protein [Solirubrobacter ginsenosidimutans]
MGTVESVAPHEIRVSLDLDAPQAVALNAGEPQRFPRINGFVLIPNEIGSVVGIVTWLGVERSPFPKRTGLRDFGLVDLPYPLRKLTLVPLGTLKSRVVGETLVYELQRGVASFPSVGDPVSLPTAAQLRALVEARDVDRRVTIGHSPLGADARVSVDPDKLFGRHLAVLGNTGSGKSCSVAGLIRWSLEDAAAARVDKSKPVNARFIVLDPNGEYRRTFEDLGQVRLFEVVGGQIAESEKPKAQPLRVPAWMWDSHEWAAFAQAAPATQRPLLLQGLRNMRSGAILESGPALRLARMVGGHRVLLRDRVASVPAYTGRYKGAKDCGIQLDAFAEGLERYRGEIPAAEGELDALIGGIQSATASRRNEWTPPGENRPVVSFDDFSEGALEDVLVLIDKLLATLPSPHPLGGSNEDAPIEFDPTELAGHLEVLAGSAEFAQAAAWAGTLLLRVRSMLADSRVGPIAAPPQDITLAQWLEDYLGLPDGSNGSIAVLDLSLVPAEVLHLVIAVLSRLIFEALQRYRRLNGVELPTALVLEEAHTFVQRYLPDETISLAGRQCRETFERIAREGRKFGLGLVLSSQRPSELSPTVLAQCNTFLLHRLVNDQDQQLVARLVPDNLGGLLRELPSMPSQQAILLGWATPVPVLVEMRHLPKEQRPHAADPQFWGVWTGSEKREAGWEPVITDWTGDSG